MTPCQDPPMNIEWPHQIPECVCGRVREGYCGQGHIITSSTKSVELRATLPVSVLTPFFACSTTVPMAPWQRHGVNQIQLIGHRHISVRRTDESQWLKWD